MKRRHYNTINKYPAGPGFEPRRQKSVKRPQVEMADTLDRSATELCDGKSSVLAFKYLQAISKCCIRISQRIVFAQIWYVLKA